MWWRGILLSLWLLWEDYQRGMERLKLYYWRVKHGAYGEYAEKTEHIITFADSIEEATESLIGGDVSILAYSRIKSGETHPVIYSDGESVTFAYAE